MLTLHTTSWIVVQLNLAGPLMHVGGSIAFEVSTNPRVDDASSRAVLLTVRFV